MNATACQSHARSPQQEPQLEFWKRMAILMINNTLDDNENTDPVLEGPRRRSMAHKTIGEHKMETKPLYASKWLGM